MARSHTNPPPSLKYLLPRQAISARRARGDPPGGGLLLEGREAGTGQETTSTGQADGRDIEDPDIKDQREEEDPRSPSPASAPHPAPQGPALSAGPPPLQPPGGGVIQVTKGGGCTW